jgi:hypothetical protein
MNSLLSTKSQVIFLGYGTLLIKVCIFFFFMKDFNPETHVDNLGSYIKLLHQKERAEFIRRMQKLEKHFVSM